MGRYEEALADFNRAIELDPDDAWAIGSRGQTYQADGAAMRRPWPTSTAPSNSTPTEPGPSAAAGRPTG